MPDSSLGRAFRLRCFCVVSVSRLAKFWTIFSAFDEEISQLALLLAGLQTREIFNFVSG